MTNPIPMDEPLNDPLNDPLLEHLHADALLPEAILLTPDQTQQAFHLSQNIPDPEQQWTAYLNALARIGFEQWLQERSPDLAARIRPQSPDRGSPLAPLSTLYIGDYGVCLIAMGSLTADRIAVPMSIFNPDDIPHLYVLIEVWEEQDCINIYGHLRRDQLLIWHPPIPLLTDATTTAWLSLDWFDNNADTLLLYLRCLSPNAIPVIRNQKTEGMVSNASMITPTINAGCWLRDRLDEVAQSLSWVLLPPLAVTFRDTATPAEQFDTVTMELQKQGIAIPPQARGAYQNVTWENVALRLYAVTWLESQSPEVPEWTLLLILGAQPGHQLPIGATLKVEDHLQVLDQQTLSTRQPDAYLFTRVIGEWNEQFRVTIDLTNGTTVRLPPFCFQPNA